ncbi:alpha-galactosidase [Fulvitalea axinellae]
MRKLFLNKWKPASLLLALVIVFSGTLKAQTTGKIIHVNTDDVSIVLSVDENGIPVFRHFGKRLAHPEEVTLESRDLAPNYGYRYDLRQAFPTFGAGYIYDPMLKVTHADGNLSTDLKFEGQRTWLDANDRNITHTELTLKDRVYPLTVKIFYDAYAKENVITQRMSVTNSGKKPVMLEEFASSFAHFKRKSYHLTHFAGDWASEMGSMEEELFEGTKVIDSKSGTRSSRFQNGSFMLSVDAPGQEKYGEVYAGALAWSGNFRMAFHRDHQGQLHVLAGAHPFGSAYPLAKGEVFETPKMVWTYSDQGKGLASRNLHRWAREYALRDGAKERPIVLNSWEGAYFDFDEKVLTDMMNDASAMGVEMFVLDDGWFGNKYPRNNDDAGLGDWQVNKKKLPRGIPHLVNHAESQNINFGIWIEPEMVNPRSELAENHPEWIVQRPNRELKVWRDQLLLDLTNPKVQDFVFTSIDNILSANPKIAYVKWDSNRHVENIGSTHLPKKEQSRFWVDYTKGLYKIYDRLVAKHPSVILQVCSSGGGRLDYGSLPYHHEFWASDDTDPYERIFIQWGTNHIYPAIATGSHVSAQPNHQTGRLSPLKFRFDVAMSGRLGLELQPKHMNAEEKVFSKKAIETYKAEIRPVVQFGDLYRLHSPYERDGWASIMYAKPEKDEAILFAYSIQHHNREEFPIIRLDGLDAKARYRITELNKNGKSHFSADGKAFSGEYLMNAGLEIRINEYAESAVFKLTKE